MDAQDLYMQRCLKGLGYQMRNWRYTQSLCAAGGSAIDVGASIGMNSLNYADYFDWVHAYEPDPDCYECLLETLTANQIDSVQTYPVALTNHSDTATMVQFPRATFANTLKPLGYTGRSRPQITVQCARMDDYTYSELRFIKIDVEGWELAVLQGATRTIHSHRPVCQVEIKPQMLRRMGATAQDLFDWFECMGYVPQHWRGDVSALVYAPTRITQQGQTHNLTDFWFVPQERVDLTH